MLNAIMQIEYLITDCTMIALVSLYVVYLLAVKKIIENRVRDDPCPTVAQPEVTVFVTIFYPFT